MIKSEETTVLLYIVGPTAFRPFVHAARYRELVRHDASKEGPDALEPEAMHSRGLPQHAESKRCWAWSLAGLGPAKYPDAVTVRDV